MKNNQFKELLQNKMVLAALLLVLTAGTALAGVVAMRNGERGEQDQKDPGHISQTEEDLGNQLIQLPQDDLHQPEELPEKTQDPENITNRPAGSGDVEAITDKKDLPGKETTERDVQMPADTLAEGELPEGSETLVDGDGAVVYEPETEADAAVAGMPLSFAAGSTIAWPVNGNIVLDYSMDTTTYFPTLKQYKCNPGILIQAEVGQPVNAAVRGIVTVIGSNEELGNFIMMDLGDDYSILYGQLEEIEVSVGQTVEAGTLLGKVAQPTKYYVVEGPNMYLEMRHHQNPVDPLDYIR